ncbi:MAG TPA: LamG-like jellyroll fold domain-containing protein [Terriglobales bacterium]|nr:LamG-like jellyroll fold domain-containing protein [Terriglobales bacterium]
MNEQFVTACTAMVAVPFLIVVSSGRSTPAVRTAQPAISRVVNAAGYQPVIAPASWITIYGANLAPDTRSWRADEIINGKLPTRLDGVSVTVNGAPAFVSYISPTQINAQAPDDTTTGIVPVVVTNNGVTSASANVALDQYSPAVLMWPGNYAVATRTDFSWAVKAGEFPGVTTAPAKPNDVIILWGTGFGPTNPSVPAGQNASANGHYTLTATPTITVAGIAANYVAGGPTPGNAGLYQVAFRVPANAPDGDLPVGVTVNGRTSPSGVFLTVTNPMQILAPSNLEATAESASQISLTWTDPVSVGLKTHIERSTSASGTYTEIATVGPTVTTYQDTGLASFTTYLYRVRIETASGLSAYSNVASATTLQGTISGLVAAYGFNEGAGTTVTDSSGNGNTGTITNATWTSAGKYGSALAFNGTNALVTINDAASLHLTTAMTLEAWVNPGPVVGEWEDVIYKSNDNYYLSATSNKSAPAGGGTFGAVDVVTYGTAALPQNTWSHVAVTYDGATLVLYVNGVQVSSLARTGNILTSNNPLQIGGDTTYRQYFQGTIDEVRVYNAALTAAQIQADMSSPIGSASVLPVVSLRGANVAFGNQTTGTTSNAQTVTLANTGGAVLTISGITISGTNSNDFAQTNNCASSIAPNSSCAISVTFTPSATGTRSATITMSDNAPGSPHTIALSGTGLASTTLSISPGVAALTPTRTQQFTANLTGIIWSVDGVVNGSASSGTITNAGLYSPPTSAGTHTVTAITSDHAQSASATVYITIYPGTFTHRNDNLRTGQNLSETVLTPANVNASTFGKLYSYALDGVAHASPLYVANVSIPGQGFHNVVYVATEHDSVYAFDADGLSSSPLWHVSFINPAAGITTVPPSDTGECCDIRPEIGITGTPVIDPGTGTLYVVAKTKEVVVGTTSYVQRLHALDITTGAEKFGGPVVIQASVAGTGDGAQAGRVPFNALHENQRPALLLSNGVVYVGFASHGDNPPYHGWVLGYNAANLQEAMAYNDTANGSGGGIWQSGGGLAADSVGNIYFVTGNGTFDADISGVDYGDSFEKISPSGTVMDYFTPLDQGALNSGNADLGAGGVLLLPDNVGVLPHLLLSAGKDGTIYLVNRDNMGHYNPSSNQNVQSLVNIFPNGTPEPGNFSAPVYFNGHVYFSPIADSVKAFQLTYVGLSTAPTSQSPEVYGYPGGAMAISANGNTNGILWVVQKNGTSVGVLRAYDANNLATELYNSNQSGSRDTMDVAAKFSIPLIANGKAFVASQSQLTVYGLLP